MPSSTRPGYQGYSAAVCLRAPLGERIWCDVSNKKQKLWPRQENCKSPERSWAQKVKFLRSWFRMPIPCAQEGLGSWFQEAFGHLSGRSFRREDRGWRSTRKSYRNEALVMPKDSLSICQNHAKRQGHPSKIEEQLEWTHACESCSKSRLICDPKVFFGGLRFDK